MVILCAVAVWMRWRMTLSIAQVCDRGHGSCQWQSDDALALGELPHYTPPATNDTEHADQARGEEDDACRLRRGNHGGREV